MLWWLPDVVGDHDAGGVATYAQAGQNWGASRPNQLITLKAPTVLSRGNVGGDEPERSETGVASLDIDEAGT
jgi:hypothetical protein